MLISRLVENLVKSIIYCVGIYTIVKWAIHRSKGSKQDFSKPIHIDTSL
ncbi:hypothetical protein [Siphovirus Jomon_CT89]|nr:hypothetical protein [Siphovirus Jomon_CT89]